MNPFITEDELAEFSGKAQGPFGFVASFRDRLTLAEIRGWSENWEPTGEEKRVVTVKTFARN